MPFRSRPPPPARARAARLALAVPTLTLVAATSALLVGASPRSLVAVRVFGGPGGGPGPHALRLACVRRAVGVEDPVALAGLRVEIEGRAEGASCDETGHADVALPAGFALPERPAIVVRQGELVLARGRAEIGARAWRDAFHRRPARVPVAATPARPFELWVPGGMLAVGQRASARLWLRDAPPDAPPPRVQALGAEVEKATALAGAPSDTGGPGDTGGRGDAGGPGDAGERGDAGAPGDTGGRGRGWAFDVRPTFVQASLSFAPGPGDEARWQAEAALPVVAGAPVVEALSREGDRLRARVRSPAGRADAYARIVDPSGRRHGARLRLTDRSAEGWPEGDFSAPAPPAGGPAWLVVSASADGGPGVSLPLPPGDEPRDGAWVSDLLWVDGLVEASADDRARGRRARWAVAALVASGALLEAWLLVALQRARGPLEVVSGAGAGASGGGLDEGDERVPLRPLRAGWLAVVLGVVWLGFVVVGILLGAGLG